MATKAKKAAAPKKTKAAQSKSAQSKTGTGTSAAGKKTATKETFGKAAPKTVRPAPAKSSAKPAKSEAEKPSVASRVMRRVTKTATGAVAMAASVIGKDGKSPKAKSK
jgi:hypothetical protein